jgi:hypothetical protein
MDRKHRCGSPAIHCFSTDEWRANDARPYLAMAASGAAASSHMGLGSMPTLAAPLTLV